MDGEEYIESPNMMKRLIFIISAVIISGMIAYSQNADSWPCFHGPDRNNKSTLTGLLRKWPAGGPKLVYTISGLGDGYSSVSFGGGLMFTAGMYNNQSCIFAFDMTGKPAWRKADGDSWIPSSIYASSYTGPRSTPTYDNGKVYFLSERGRLAVYDAKSGKEIWAKDLAKDFDAKETLYGYSESVYIDGNKLYVKPYGRLAYQACLDKNNGSLIWANKDIPGNAGYCSAVVFDFGGFRHVIGSSSSCYYGVDAATGRLLWKVDFENIHEVSVTDATVKDGYVSISSPYGKGTMVFKLNPSGNRFIPEKVWESDAMDNEVGGIILHDGYLYGTGYNSRGWFCLDFKTGRQMWNITRAKGSITFADGMLYLIDERTGNMSLVKASPEKYELAGEFKIPSGGEGPYWSHPVVYGKRLYVRHWNKIFVYDLAQE